MGLPVGLYLQAMYNHPSKPISIKEHEYAEFIDFLCNKLGEDYVDELFQEFYNESNK